VKKRTWPGCSAGNWNIGYEDHSYRFSVILKGRFSLRSVDKQEEEEQEE
jgi:hypothetical protein